jgi:hypothetical protein
MLTTDRQARKDAPLARGVLDYFPDALVAVAHVSRVGSEQHHPGPGIWWEKNKSDDHADCILRHLADRGTIDSDGTLHSAKVAWRALALLQTEIDELAQRALEAHVAAVADRAPPACPDLDQELPAKCARCHTLYREGERHACADLDQELPSHRIDVI